MKALGYWLLLFALATCGIVRADNLAHPSAVFTPRGSELQSLEPYSEFIEDPQGKLTISDLTTGQVPEFRPIKSFVSHGFTNVVYWVKIQIDLKGFDEPYWFLRKDYINVGRISVYYPTETGYSHYDIDEREKAYGRMFSTTSFISRLPSNKASPATYYIRVEPRQHHVNLLFSWGSDKAIIEATHNYDFFLGIFYGGCLIMLLYNAVLLATTRDITYLFYLYYLVCFLILFAHINGLLSLMIVRSEFLVRTVMLSILGMTHGGLLYVRSFLNLRTTYPFYDKLLKWYSWLLAPVAIACLFLPQGHGFEVALAAIPGSCILGLPICFYRWYKGFEPARIYCLGWAVFLLLGVNYVLQAFGIVGENNLAVYCVEAGSLWEIVMSSLALAYRIKIADQQRKVALTLSKEKLEREVFARTKELEASRNEAIRTDAEKRKLIQKVNTIVEDERRAIAIEIHDELNATLVGARHGSQRILMLAAKLEQNDEIAEIATRAESILSMTKALYATGRAIVTRLRPEILDTLGLSGAIEEMVQHYDSSNPTCRFSFESDGDFSNIDSDLAMAAYRLTQEALSNVVKHAKATKAVVTLELPETEILRVVIQDNGIGFDVSKVLHGLGIIGMRERAYGYNGSVQVRSESAIGTEIEAIFPIRVAAV